MNNLQRYRVNNQLVWRGRLSKINGVRQENTSMFTIRPLNKSDAEAMGNLSTTIYQNLGEGEECFIHRHDKEYYHKIFNDKDIHYIGVFAGSNLIGMSYIHICRNEDSFNDEIPNSPVNFFARDGVKAVAAMGADCVHPDYRGNHLNQTMIKCRLELASDLGCNDAFSIIDRSNHWNMPPYFNNGFNMYGTAIDPSDGGKIALMHHSFAKKQKEISGIGVSIPFNRFDLIDNMLAKGFVGSRYDVDKGVILFVNENRAKTKNNMIFMRDFAVGVRRV